MVSHGSPSSSQHAESPTDFITRKRRHSRLDDMEDNGPPWGITIDSSQLSGHHGERTTYSKAREEFAASKECYLIMKEALQKARAKVSLGCTTCPLDTLEAAVQAALAQLKVTEDNLVHIISKSTNDEIMIYPHEPAQCQAPAVAPGRTRTPLLKRAQPAQPTGSRTISHPPQAIGQVVHMKQVVKTNPAKPACKAKSNPTDIPQVNPDSPFQRGAGVLVDLTDLVIGIGPEAKEDICKVMESMTPDVFHWGSVLWPLVEQCISHWRFKESDLAGHPSASELGQFSHILAGLPAFDSWKSALKSAPRLLQLSTQDPYFREDSINWDMVEESTKHPFKERHGVYQVLHALSCRSTVGLRYSREKDVQAGIQHGFNELASCFISSIQFVSQSTSYAPAIIETEGPESIPAESLAFSRAMSWVFTQVAVQDKQDEQKTEKHGIWKLRRRFWEVLLAVLIIGESKMYSDQAACLEATSDTSQQQLSMIKKDLRKKTILSQLIPAGVRQRQQMAAFRKKCLQSLSLFLLYGTAGFFPVWRDDTRPSVKEAAQLLHLASTLTIPRDYEPPPHKFNSRPYVRCDAHLMGLLQNLITKSQFTFDFDWESMTDQWREDMDVGAIAHMFTADFVAELLNPGFSRGFTGDPVRSIAWRTKSSDYELHVTDLKYFVVDPDMSQPPCPARPAKLKRIKPLSRDLQAIDDDSGDMEQEDLSGDDEYNDGS